MESNPSNNNRNLQDIVTPIKVDVFEQLLTESKYDPKETAYLIDGFKNSFDIEYEGPTEHKDYANNIPFKSVGSSQELWEKLMKEVNLKRYAGLFDQCPYEFFIQSPIGLVPKAGNKTRLIFHLSYDFPRSGFGSVNSYTKKEKCSIKYNDLDVAVRLAINLMKKTGCEKIYCAKTDLSAAFRMIPLKRSCWPWLLMKAKDPTTGQFKSSNISLKNACHLATALVVPYFNIFPMH